MTPTDTEAALHAACTAGDLGAYAALEDFYLENNAAEAATAVRALATLGRFPLRCVMHDLPRPVLYVFGYTKQAQISIWAEAGEDWWLKSRISWEMFSKLEGSLALMSEEIDAHCVRLEAGLESPFSSGSWAYFRSAHQALEYLGRTLAP